MNAIEQVNCSGNALWNQTDAGDPFSRRKGKTAYMREYNTSCPVFAWSCTGFQKRCRTKFYKDSI